jgi:cell division protein FtsA
VSERDIARVLGAASRGSIRCSRTTLHSVPVGFSSGNIRGLRDPRNLVAHHIGVDLQVVSTDESRTRKAKFIRVREDGCQFISH